MCNAKITRYRKSEKPKKCYKIVLFVVHCKFSLQNVPTALGLVVVVSLLIRMFKECHFAASTLSIELVNKLNVSRLLLFLRFFAAESVQF